MHVTPTGRSAVPWPPTICLLEIKESQLSPQQRAAAHLIQADPKNHLPQQDPPFLQKSSFRAVYLGCLI